MDHVAECRPWWQTAVLYQIYPRSFSDSNGDGVGDLPGISARLPYLVELGVDTIWLSPFYPSPMADFGYDVADFCGVDPVFGTLADFDALVARAHELGLRVLVDFIPNHSSDQHPWFVESRTGTESPRRDCYTWRDPAPGGGPPNNWISPFGGPMWTLDEATGQYYLHSFLPQQPDLNWRNPEVHTAMADVLRFWMARGVDGFRVDVAHHVMKDPQLRDNPPNPTPSGGHKPAGPADAQRHIHDRNHPDNHDLYRWLRGVVDGFDHKERVMVGEIHLSDDLPMWASYFGASTPDGWRGEIHLPQNFGLLNVPWTAEGLRTHVEAIEAIVPTGCWPSYVLGNHDEIRLAARLGADNARLAAMLLLTLRGTPTLYVGDELGISDVVIPVDRIQDPAALRTGIPGLGRDAGRTPMAWDASPNAGFSDAPEDDLWLPLHKDHAVCNVEIESTEPGSTLSLYRRLLRFRQNSPALQTGSYRTVDAGPSVFAYERSHDAECVRVQLNLTGHPTLPPTDGRPWEMALSTHDGDGPADAVLRPHEGRILVLRP